MVTVITIHVTTYYVSGTVLSISHLTLIATPWGRFCYLHITDRETEAQKRYGVFRGRSSGVKAQRQKGPAASLSAKSG